MEILVRSKEKQKLRIRSLSFLRVQNLRLMCVMLYLLVQRITYQMEEASRPPSV
jgi:hypothetical protein